MKVLYEDEWFLGKKVTVVGKSCLQCLEKPYRVNESHDLEPERDIVLYDYYL